MIKHSPKKREVIERRAADFAARNSFRPFSEMMKQFYSREGVSFAQAWMSRAIKKQHGISYTELQKRNRLKFIEENEGKSNKWLCKKLDISVKTLSRLTRELKEDGRVKASKRYAQTKNAVKTQLPLAYNGSVHAVMRFLFWAPISSGLSIHQLSTVLEIPQKTVEYATRLARQQDLIQSVRREGRVPYLAPTKQGVIWLRKMQALRKERDAILEKNSSISSVISRKEKERNRLTNAVVFIQRKGNRLNTAGVYGAVKEIDAEIKRLKKVQRDRKNT